MYPEAARVWTKSNYDDRKSSHYPHHDDALESRTANITISSSSSTTTNISATHKNNTNEDGTHGEELPIHLYCQNHFCNILVLQQLLIPAYPESMQTFSSRTGQLPIHMVCERQYFQRVSNKKYDSKNTVSSKSSSSHSDAIIRYCVSLYPRSVGIRDLQRGELPFSTALRGYQTFSTLQHLLSLYAAAITTVDQKGRTPLHRYCMMLASHKSGGNTNDTTTIDNNDNVLSLLLLYDTQRVAGTIMDQSGCTPLQYVIGQRNVSLDVIYSLVRSYPTSILQLVSAL